MWTSIYRDTIYVIQSALTNLYAYFYDDKEILLQNGDDNPILLIHGGGNCNKQWFVCKKIIKKYLPNNSIYAIDLYQNNPINKEQNINEFTQIAKKDLENIYRKYNKPVIIIGHSMGGLIALQLLDTNDDMIKTVISIGAPIQGAPLLKTNLISKFFNEKHHIDMVPNSYYLNELYKIILKTKKSILTIGSVNDFHAPDEYARIPVDIVIAMRNPKLSHVTLKDYGHGSIINNDETWYFVSLWLNQLDSSNKSV